MKRKPWPKYRHKQLTQFDELLREASMIDSGSSAIRRIVNVIRLARALMKTNYNGAGKRHKSFIGFLIAEASGPKE